MKKLQAVVIRKGQEHVMELDEFYKSLVFQEILDSEFTKYEKFVLLVILRKTLHFNKRCDRLAMHWLSKATGVGLTKLRETIKQLEYKGLVDINHSKGGRTSKKEKFNEYALSDNILSKVLHEWVGIKDELGILEFKMVA